MDLVDTVASLTRRGKIDLLLLDIGGVLFPDPWQTLILTPVHGLADRLNSPNLGPVAKRLWREFSIAPRPEAEYWEALSLASGADIPDTLVREIETELLIPFPWASELLATPVGGIGLVSDNTSFWFHKQAVGLGLEQHTIAPCLLSFEQGFGKKNRPLGLFEVAAALTGTQSVLVIEDRYPNVMRATEAGFLTIHLDLR